jgi:hypothetical protein
VHTCGVGPTDSGHVELASFAGEVSRRAPAKAPSVRLARARGTLAIGLRAGLVPSLAVLLIYYAMHHDAPVRWARLATFGLAYGTMVGLLLTFGVDLVSALFDRVARAGRWLAALCNPVTAGGIGGALAGVLPGLIATTSFHDIRGPFMGVPLIAGSLIAGSLLAAVPLAGRAHRERRPGGPTPRLRLLVATVVATAIAGLAWAIFSPILVAYAYAEAYGTVSPAGATAGMLAGSAGGAALGLYVGIVVAVGRGARQVTRQPG